MKTMNQEQTPFDSQDAHKEEVRRVGEYIDSLDSLTEQEREKLKDNVRHPGIQERVLEIKYAFEETDPEAKYRAHILLESLRSDIKDFPERL
jgi:hypothetical protein